MALTGTGTILGQAIKAAVDQVEAARTSGTPVDRDAMFDAIGNAIINHFVANGVAAVAGVTPGFGVASLV